MKFPRISTLLIIALACLGARLQAAETETETLQMQSYRHADEVTRGLIRKVVDGMGGADRLAHVSALEKRCAIEQRLPKPVHVDFDGVIQFPDGMFATMKLPSRKLTAVRSGDIAFVYRSNSPIAGAALKLNEAERRTFTGFFYSHPVGVLQNRIHTQYRFAAAGEDAIAGRPVDVLAINAEGYDLLWYIDRTSGHVIRTKFEDRVIDFDDWRDVDGLVLPFRETVTRNDAVESRTTVTSFKVNPQVDPAVFNSPRFWEERYNLPARDEFTRMYTVYYYFYWLYY